MPEITTEWQRFETLMAGEPCELLRFRQSIFVVEQRSPYPTLMAWTLSHKFNSSRRYGSGVTRLPRLSIRRHAGSRRRNGR